MPVITQYLRYIKERNVQVMRSYSNPQYSYSTCLSERKSRMR